MPALLFLQVANRVKSSYNQVMLNTAFKLHSQGKLGDAG